MSRLHIMRRILLRVLTFIGLREHKKDGKRKKRNKTLSGCFSHFKWFWEFTVISLLYGAFKAAEMVVA